MTNRHRYGALTVGLLLVAILGAGCGTSTTAHSARQALTAVAATSAPTTTVPAVKTTTAPPVTTTTNPCQNTTGVLDPSCPPNSPSGEAFTARIDQSVTTTTPPPCAGNVTATIAVSKVQVAGASVNVTVIGTVYNGRSDPIHNDEVGFVVWYGGVGFGYSVGGVAQGQTVPYYPEMLPGQTGNVSGEVSLIPAAGTPPTVSVVISEISYSDNSDAPGCGGQTQVSTTTTTTTSRPTGGGGGGGTSFNPDPNGDGGGTTGAGFGSQ